MVLDMAYNLCGMFLKYGWRRAFIQKSINPNFARDIEDYSIVDSLKTQMEREYMKQSTLELSEEVLYSILL